MKKNLDTTVRIFGVPKAYISNGDLHRYNLEPGILSLGSPVTHSNFSSKAFCDG